MKNVMTKISALAVFAMLLMGCSNSALESKIARLEGKIAELESGGVRKTANAPAKSNAKPTAPEEKPTGPLPSFSFNKEAHDFGKINEGDVVEYAFEFTNTGKAPLIISAATGSCGCTVPEWPKEPIGVGETSQILVKFNSNKKPGLQNKTVTITSNTYPKQTKIKIKANVTPKAKTDSPS